AFLYTPPLLPCPLSLHAALPISAFATTDSAVQAMKLGAYDYLTKPFKVDEIQVVVQRALERVDLGSENQRLRDELRGVWRLEGRSEEHTSELQSRENLVCRLLLE